MKLAIIFDDLIQFGGAERLLLAAHELYPDAPVYTTVASEAWQEKCLAHHIDLRTSYMQKLPFKVALNRFYGLAGLHTLAFESFKFDEYDVVLSISARFAHGVVCKPGTLHICYMNSPGRMFWEMADYFSWAAPWQWAVAAPFLSLLRLWDYTAAQRVDYFIANSRTPQSRIAKYYGRTAQIIYPFVESSEIAEEKTGVGEGYLVISRLISWKRIDLAIKACCLAGIPLTVIGDGPEKPGLMALATNDQVRFLGYVSEEEKQAAIDKCRALIVTQKEDFGLAALEAMARGKPVIAYGAGGALETVIAGVTGEFFEAQTADSLAKVLAGFDPLNYQPAACVRQASKFTKQKFLAAVDEFIKKVYDDQTVLH
ncbi:glycosyltransferase [Patescibacteria group bacterium]|nr:glycosyltransferase [Patescibacteria group bacterium]MBU1970671.1 glycosyltransferase [Patescibacteria group bacterium]